MKRCSRLALFATFATALFAQSNRGGITGTIFDPEGALVPGAKVTLINLGTNQRTEVVSSGSGSYNFVSLEPVLYRVTVGAAGFKETSVDNIKVDTATVATVNITLVTGSVSSEITVQADTAAVNTESGTTGSTITERQIYDMPLVNRSVLDLAMTLPNISGDVGSEEPAVTAIATVPGYNVNVNGGRSGSTVFLADGVNNTGVGIARAVATFSPETVQEFTVLTSAYSAEFGSTGGGVVNVTTKSGSNQFNGTALWYSRNPSLNAAPFTVATVNRPTSNLRDTQFSLTGGGPVVIPKIYNGRDKTFFFGAFEPRRRSDHLQATACLPTDAMRAGDFSNLTSSNQCWAPASVQSQFG